MSEDDEVWFHSSRFPEVRLSWVGAIGATGLTESIQTGFLAITASFTKAGHGIVLAISADIRSGLTTRPLVFHPFYGGPTTLICPGHHCPLEVLLQCCASASPGVPGKGLD